MVNRLFVVPRRTNQTPASAWTKGPEDWMPKIKNVDISVVFTKDLKKARNLYKVWVEYGANTIMGGPAFDDPCTTDFIPGKYVQHGVVHTSRGCPNKCPWCDVPGREGPIRTLPITIGPWIQDNNLLACPSLHIQKVFEMLRSQYKVRFLGGLEPERISDGFIEDLRSLRIKEIFTACDTEARKKPALDAIRRLRQAGFGRDHIRCYALHGFGGSTMEQDHSRMIELWEAGCMPFAQLYDKYKAKDKADLKARKNLARSWSRPCATRTWAKIGFLR